MKIVQGFECELCGDLFDDSDVCAEHEGNHIEDHQLEITGARHHSDTDVTYFNFDLMVGRFPHTIIVEKKDYSGSAARYRLDAAGSMEDIYSEEDE